MPSDLCRGLAHRVRLVALPRLQPFCTHVSTATPPQAIKYVYMCTQSHKPLPYHTRRIGIDLLVPTLTGGMGELALGPGLLILGM